MKTFRHKDDIDLVARIRKVDGYFKLSFYRFMDDGYFVNASDEDGVPMKLVYLDVNEAINTIVPLGYEEE